MTWVTDKVLEKLSYKMIPQAVNVSLKLLCHSSNLTADRKMDWVKYRVILAENPCSCLLIWLSLNHSLGKTFSLWMYRSIRDIPERLHATLIFWWYTMLKDYLILWVNLSHHIALKSLEVCGCNMKQLQKVQGVEMLIATYCMLVCYSLFLCLFKCSALFTTVPFSLVIQTSRGTCFRAAWKSITPPSRPLSFILLWRVFMCACVCEYVGGVDEGIILTFIFCGHPCPFWKAQYNSL